MLCTKLISRRLPFCTAPQSLKLHRMSSGSNPNGMRPTITNIDNAGDSLTVAWSDGQHSHYPSIYLRDNDPSSKAANGQRLFETFELDDTKTNIAAHEPHGSELQIKWGDDEKSHFSTDWLFDNSCNATHRKQRNTSAAAAIELWDTESLKKPISVCSYEEAVHATDETHRIAIYTELRRHGVCLVSDVPTIETDRPTDRDGSDQQIGVVRQIEPSVIRLGNILGHVRATNYGTHFDVRVEQSRADNKNHPAYTANALAAHTDNPYRNPTPGVQILHCLQQAQNSPSAGTSLLIDGFKVAEQLRKDSPADFALLTIIKRPFTYYDESGGYKFHMERHVIGVDPRGNVDSLHYNNRSASCCDWNIDERHIEAYYRAWKRLGSMLHDADDRFAMEFRLEEGQIIIFDNTRVLHGRRGYELSGDDQNRHLQGCYIDFDSVWGRLDGHEHTQKTGSGGHI